MLGNGRAEWRLYANAPDKRGYLRTLLLSPIARMRIEPPKKGNSAEMSAQAALLSGGWELCLPTISSVELAISHAGDQVDSWQVNLGLSGEWDGHKRWRTWHIAADAEVTAALDRDVSGRYELLESCPAAMGSLHKRVEGGDGLDLLAGRRP